MAVDFLRQKRTEYRYKYCLIIRVGGSCLRSSGAHFSLKVPTWALKEMRRVILEKLGVGSGAWLDIIVFDGHGNGITFLTEVSRLTLEMLCLRFEGVLLKCCVWGLMAYSWNVVSEVSGLTPEMMCLRFQGLLQKKCCGWGLRAYFWNVVSEV